MRYAHFGDPVFFASVVTLVTLVNLGCRINRIPEHGLESS